MNAFDLRAIDIADTPLSFEQQQPILADWLDGTERAKFKR
jgi:hypothetical protein